MTSSKRVKILIVEDDIMLREQMTRFLEQKYEISGKVGSGEEALSILNQNQPDLVLMDIELDGQLDGIRTAELIHEKLFIPIIYLSRLYGDRTLNRVKKTLPAAYLSKPFKNHDLKYAIESAIYNNQLHPGKNINLKENQQETFVVSVFKNRLFYKKRPGEFYRIFVEDIFYIEFADRKCKMITKFGLEDLRISFKDFFVGIKNSDIIRVHRKFGVNINYIDQIIGNTIYMAYPGTTKSELKMEIEIPIGMDYKNDLKKKLGMSR